MDASFVLFCIGLGLIGGPLLGLLAAATVLSFYEGLRTLPPRLPLPKRTDDDA